MNQNHMRKHLRWHYILAFISVCILLAWTSIALAAQNIPNKSTSSSRSVMATGNLTVTGTQLTDSGCQSTSVTVTGTITGTVDDGGGYETITFNLWDDGELKDHKDIQVAVGTTQNVSITLSFNSLYGTSAPGVGVAVDKVGFDEDPFYPTDVSGTCLNTKTMSVSKIGTGVGTVTSNPSGIDCGSDCNENYTTGATVTLTATAASGSTFIGWSGACSGASATCTVTMDADKNTTAEFAVVLCTDISTKPYTFTAGSAAKASEVNANFDELYTQINALYCQVKALKKVVCQGSPTADICK